MASEDIGKIITIEDSGIHLLDFQDIALKVDQLIEEAKETKNGMFYKLYTI